MPSPTDVDEVRSALHDLNTLAVRDLTRYWRRIEDQDRRAKRNLLVDAAYALVSPFLEAAAMLGATHYEQLLPGSEFQAVTADPTSREAIEASARWAASALWRDGSASPLVLQAGSNQRRIFGAFNETILANVAAEPGARWARYASATACPFCRVMAIRGAVFRTEDSGAFRAHDHCRCLATAVRPGDSWEPPGYVAKWEDQYRLAARETDGSISQVVAHMQGQEPKNPA